MLLQRMEVTGPRKRVAANQVCLHLSVSLVYDLSTMARPHAATKKTGTRRIGQEIVEHASALAEELSDHLESF
jgi:hypothetical protein